MEFSIWPSLLRIICLSYYGHNEFAPQRRS